MAIGAIGGLIISTLVNIGANQIRKRQLKKQQDAANNRGRDITITDSASNIPIVYGYTQVAPPRVYFRAGSSITLPPASKIGRINAGNGRKHEFSLSQFVLSVGEIEEVVDVKHRDTSIKDEPLLWEIAATVNEKQWAKEFSTANGNTERNDNTKFSNLSYLTVGARHQNEKGVLLEEPAPIVFLKGRKIPTVVKTGSSYSYSTTKTFSTNPIRVLLDFLIDIWKVPVATFDLQSFYNAQEICEQITQPASTDTATIATDIVPKEVLENVAPSLITDPLSTTYTQLESYLGIPDSNGNVTGWDPDATIWQNENPSVHRFDFNYALDSAESLTNNIQRIIESVPGILFDIDETNGRIIVNIPTPDSTSVATVGQQHLTQAVSIETQGTNTRLNGAVGIYKDAYNEYENNTVRFPTAGSTLSTNWIAQDNNLILENRFDFPQIISKQQTNSLLANKILTSRRDLYTFFTSLSHFHLQNGDIVRLVDPSMNLNVLVRIISRSIGSTIGSDTTEIQFTAIQFNPIDYGWYPDSKSLRDAILTVDHTLGNPFNVQVQSTADQPNGITWQANTAESNRVIDYISEVRSAGSWGPAFIADKNTHYAEHIPTVQSSNIQYRIAARAANGQRSDWAYSANTVFSITQPVTSIPPPVRDGYVYYNDLTATIAPATPSATRFNFSTQEFVGLTSGWSIQPNTLAPGTFVNQYKSRFKVTSGTRPTFAAPELGITLSGTTTWTTGPDGIRPTAGTTIDPFGITTGKMTASLFNLNNFYDTTQHWMKMSNEGVTLTYNGHTFFSTMNLGSNRSNAIPLYIQAEGPSPHGIGIAADGNKTGLIAINNGVRPADDVVVEVASGLNGERNALVVRNQTAAPTAKISSAGVGEFTSLIVSGDVTIAGNLNVGGKLTVHGAIVSNTNLSLIP